MPLNWEQVVIDAQDPQALGHWWARGLNWVVTSEDDTAVEIRSSAEAIPGILFLRVTEDRVTKNRLHLDFRPIDQNVEVERLLNLGATRCDIGQGEVSWVVLADPEGNEFCILRPH
jgi:hypothetical protein